MVEQIIRDDFPIKDDQFAYTGVSYLQALHMGQYHAPDWVNYDLILKDLQLLPRVANNDFEEVWLFGGPNVGRFSGGPQRLLHWAAYPPSAGSACWAVVVDAMVD